MSSNFTPQKLHFRDGSGSWLIPAGSLVLFLVTAAAFFFATAPRPSGGTAVTEDLPQPIHGGTLRVPLMEEPVHTLDPARIQFGSEILIVQQIFDGLTALDDQLNVVPSLARYWEISHDGMTYTFELRPDAVFHNGQPVTAEDCVYSFRRLLSPGLNVNNYHYFSRIEGAREFHEGLAKDVSGLRAIDEKTFQIRFTSPFVPALSVLSMYCSKILPKGGVLEHGDEFFLAPVGTGPFKFSRWINRDEDSAVPVSYGIPQAIRLEANPRYFGKKPFLDAVTFRSMWSSKKAKVTQTHEEMFDYLPYVPQEPPEGWVPVDKVKLLTMFYLVLPIHVPPYDDPRIRRAISYSIDKRDYLDSNPYWKGLPAASSVVPPEIPGFIPSTSEYKRNLKEARELLAEAGYPGGKGLPPLEIPYYRQSDSGEPLFASLARSLSNIGIDLRKVPAQEYVTHDDMDFGGRPVLRTSGWIADFPDPDNFLRPLFHSTSPSNLSGLSNPEVDRLLDQAWTETSYSVRNKLYRKIEAIVLNKEAPIIPLYYDHVRFLIKERVRGFSISPMGPNYVRLNRVWWSEEETQPPFTY
jgi:peptide/nickel transport system substrate-binding protein/oligopeptide transport system substrate-binding protein